MVLSEICMLKLQRILKLFFPLDLNSFVSAPLGNKLVITLDFGHSDFV